MNINTGLITENLPELFYTLAVLLFAGNMVSGLFWKLMADKTKDPKIIAHTFKGIFHSDWLISLPSLLIIAILNLMVNTDRFFPFTGVQVSLVLNILLLWAILIFLLIVHPTRKKLYQLAAEGQRNAEFDMVQYKNLSKKWMFFGFLELSPLIFVFMLSLIHWE